MDKMTEVEDSSQLDIDLHKISFHAFSDSIQSQITTHFVIDLANQDGRACVFNTRQIIIFRRKQTNPVCFA